MVSRPILADGRWLNADGIGRFTAELQSRGPADCVWLRGGPKVSHPTSPFWLTSRLRAERPGAFFSPGFVPPVGRPVPFVFTIHDLIPLQSTGESSFLIRCAFNRIIRPAARRAFRVLTDSEYSKQEIIAWTGVREDRVVVVGCGVSKEYTPDGARLQRARPYLLYVGNRTGHKNLNRLLQAYEMSGLAEQYDLVLSGKPDEELRSRLQSPAARAGLCFAGYIPEEDLPAYYRSATAAVLVSLCEGFGLPPLEALACGTPVVVSGTTSLPEVVGDVGIQVDPLDLESIADGLRRGVAGSLQDERLRAKRVARAAEFTWERTAERVWGVVEEARSSGR